MKLLSFGFLLLAAPAFALDPHSQDAMQKTHQMLKNPAERNKAIQGDARAQQADAKVQELGLNEAQQGEFYAISADVFQRLAQQAGGDPAKLEEVMLSAQSNPKAFYEKHFTAAEKARIQALATQAKPAKK